MQVAPELDPDLALVESLTADLHAEVAAMNPENFSVREHLDAVDHFRDRDAWEQLSDSGRERLSHDVAGLPSEIETDDIESRLFDLSALRMQLALVEGDEQPFESLRQRMVEIAMLLLEEKKSRIPAVQAQLGYLASMQETGFWEGVRLTELEDMRLRMRGLVTSLDKREVTIVYTDFQDEVMGIREEETDYVPRMTGAQYEKKVRKYLRNHLDHLVVHRLRTNQPLTSTDLEGLESTLVEIGEGDGETLLSGLLARSEAPSLAHFVRSLVGLDRAAAQAAFGEFLSDRSLNPSQIRFVEMVIDQLTARGVMDASALYEPPFSNIHAEGPDALFDGREKVIEGIFEKLKAVNSELIASVG